MAALLDGVRWRNASTQRVLQVMKTLTIASDSAEAKQGEATLDLDWHPQLTWAQAALCALVAGLPAVGVWHVLGTCWRPLTALVVCVLTALVTACWGRTVLLEGQYMTKQRLEAELADNDSHFRRIENIQVHVKTKQPPAPQRVARQPPAVACHCYHGFGSNTFSWSRVQEKLAVRLNAQVTAHDMPGFGLTQRPEDVSGYCLTFNGRLGRLIMDHELATHPPPAAPGPSPATTPFRVLIGHSLGAACAALETVSRPHDVSALILVAPAILALPTPQLAQSHLVRIPAPSATIPCPPIPTAPRARLSFSSLSSSDSACLADTLSDTSSTNGSHDNTPPCRHYISLPRSLSCTSLAAPLPAAHPTPPSRPPSTVRPWPLRLAKALLTALSPFPTPHPTTACQTPISYPLSRTSSLASLPDDPCTTNCSTAATPFSCPPLSCSATITRSISAFLDRLVNRSDSLRQLCKEPQGAAHTAWAEGPGAGEQVGVEEEQEGRAWRLAGLVIKWVAAVLLVSLMVLRPLMLPMLRSVVRTRGFWTLILRKAYFDKSCVTDEVVDAYRMPQLVKGFDRGVINVLLALSRGHSPFSLLSHSFKGGSGASSAADLAQHLAAAVERHGIPVLLVQGEDDVITTSSNSSRLARCLPRCQLAVFEQCGHMPQEEMPDRFVELVSTFLEAHIPRA